MTRYFMKFAMERFCYEHGGKISGGWTQNYGYVVETEHYRYCLRCNPSPGDYNCYCTAYDLDVHMKFVKYNDNKSVTIPPAVLTVCGLEDEGKLEMAGARGAVILSKSEMTAMEMVRTILALTDRAGQLMRELTDLCGSCEGCTEGHCTFRDADIEELIRPAVTVPDWAREEADIAPDAKLDCHVDEGSGVITVCETFYDHDLSDIPAELLEALRKSGCCLSVLEDMLMDDDVIYDK